MEQQDTISQDHELYEDEVPEENANDNDDIGGDFNSLDNEHPIGDISEGRSDEAKKTLIESLDPDYLLRRFRESLQGKYRDTDGVLKDKFDRGATVGIYLTPLGADQITELAESAVNKITAYSNLSERNAKELMKNTIEETLWLLLMEWERFAVASTAHFNTIRVKLDNLLNSIYYMGIGQATLRTIISSISVSQHENAEPVKKQSSGFIKTWLSRAKSNFNNPAPMGMNDMGGGLN